MDGNDVAAEDGMVTADRTAPASASSDLTVVDAGFSAMMTEICGADSVITDPQELRTYECDGLTAHRSTPGLVVLPQTAEQVAAIVRACAARRIPFVARGSGTGLSGGALPRTDGVLIVMSKMRSILAIDPGSRRAIVEPGVTNLSVSKAAEQ